MREIESSKIYFLEEKGMDSKTNNIAWVIQNLEHKLTEIKRYIVLPRNETVTSSKWFLKEDSSWEFRQDNVPKTWEWRGSHFWLVEWFELMNKYCKSCQLLAYYKRNKVWTCCYRWLLLYFLVRNSCVVSFRAVFSLYNNNINWHAKSNCKLTLELPKLSITQELQQFSSIPSLINSPRWWRRCYVSIFQIDWRPKIQHQKGFNTCLNLKFKFIKWDAKLFEGKVILGWRLYIDNV